MATDSDLPVGKPKDASYFCLQCATVIKSFQDVHWLGRPADSETQFWGYFCSKTCMGVFADRPDDDKLRAVMGSEEAVRKLVGGTNAGYYRPDGEGEDA